MSFSEKNEHGPKWGHATFISRIRGGTFVLRLFLFLHDLFGNIKAERQTCCSRREGKMNDPSFHAGAFAS